MNRLVIGLLLTIAFLVGCLAATVAAQVVAPSARAAVNSEKWRYKCFRGNAIGVADTEGIESNLIKFGMQEWELASMTAQGNYVIYCMKHRALE